ncbi:hypothetical protein, partial [Serratia symbiotica]|uniref:hypothetical protein n=1 Tax=Serratia symbiotica TaxID=138074 RepID=UPI001E6208D3
LCRLPARSKRHNYPPTKGNKKLEDEKIIKLLSSVIEALESVDARPANNNGVSETIRDLANKIHHVAYEKYPHTGGAWEC